LASSVADAGGPAKNSTPRGRPPPDLACARWTHHRTHEDVDGLGGGLVLALDAVFESGACATDLS
jgi:hypothetical protein